jgi:TolB-like protein
MRRNICVTILLLFTITGALFAQVRKDNLAVLPFTGGEGDEGEAIAERLSFNANLMARFGIIQRTSIASAVAKEQSFQTTSGMTDADTIAALGAQLGAKYVMAGSITALGSQKLLVVSIVRIETIQQVAGAYLTYNRIEELPAKFSDMMKTLLPLLDVDTSVLPKLAVLPIQMQSDATNQRDADTLAQILAIDLLQNKSYAIYPRTSSLEKVQEEFKTQQSGVTADKNAAQSGYGVNPEYVLSVTSRKLGELNMFNAAIIDLATGTMADGLSERYGTLIDGITAMESIAKGLSGEKVSDDDIKQREKEEAARIAAAAKEEAALKAEEDRVEKARIAAANRAEAERKAAANWDKFLQGAGVILGAQMGVSLISGLDKQIFGEPKPSTKVESADAEAKANSDVGFGFGGGLFVALRLGKYFAIQSGANFNFSVRGPSKLEYTYAQVPVLLRLNFALGTIGLGIFGGPAFNIPMSASSTVSFDGSDGPSQTATMTIPTSGMVGGDLSVTVFSGIPTYIGIQYTFDFGDTTVKLADGHEGTFKRSSVDLVMGFKFYIPFRR